MSLRTGNTAVSSARNDVGNGAASVKSERWIVSHDNDVEIRVVAKCNTRGLESEYLELIQPSW